MLKKNVKGSFGRKSKSNRGLGCCKGAKTISTQISTAIGVL
jgi:hypothetical protein